MNYLPGKLLKLRKHYNYSQSYLADLLNVEVIEYMAFENGRKVPDFKQCLKIATIYHVGVDEIFKNNERITLYEVSKAKTDELNIEYFLPPKTFKDRLRDFSRKYAVLLGIALGVVILGLIVLNGYTKKSEETVKTITLDNINRLSLSETTVVYIDEEGAVKGSGDNTNAQLSNLPSRNAVKVAEGSSYTLILNSDGTLSYSGMKRNFDEDLGDIKDIVDIASGDNHIVLLDSKGKVYAYGDNSHGQCEVSDFKKIAKVYATSKGTIVLDEDGDIFFCGEIVGASQLKNYKNIKDIDASNDNLVMLSDSDTVDYIAKSKNFLNIYKWKNVTDVACGDEFVAALSSDGKVYIDCEDPLMKKTVESFSDIIAIAAGDKYLIAYDGHNLYGAGENDYNQFEKEENEIITLAQVSGVKVSINNTIDVSFDKVTNAEGYEITLNAGEGNTYRVSSNQTVSFFCDDLNDNDTYEITITALGDNVTYRDSLPLVIEFVYQRDNDNEDSYVEIDADFETMTVKEFETFAKSIGINNLVGIEQNVECDGDKQLVSSVDGISKGQKILRSDLSKAIVTYNYCRIKEKVEVPDDE